MLSGAGEVKKLLWANNAKSIISAADDNCIRYGMAWYCMSGSCFIIFAQWHLISIVSILLSSPCNVHPLRSYMVLDLANLDSLYHSNTPHTLTACLVDSNWGNPVKYPEITIHTHIHRVWDVSTSGVSHTISTPSPVSSLELSRDGRTLAVTYAKTCAFYDIAK